MRSDAWQVEKDFVPETLEDVLALQRAIEASGYSHEDALRIPGWILRKNAGEDRISAPTRARYRRILRALNGNYPGPRPRKRADVTPP